MPSPWQLAEQFQVQQATNTSTFARHRGSKSLGRSVDCAMP
jgi:hypothetical protein